MQANLQAVGIPAMLRPHPFADYLKFAVSGQQEMFRLGWIGAYPTADAFLTPLFRTGLADNVTGFSSESVDELLRAGRAESDEAKRIAQLPAGREAGAGAAPSSPGPIRVPLAGERPGDGLVMSGWAASTPRGSRWAGRIESTTSEWRNRQTRQVEGLVPA